MTCDFVLFFVCIPPVLVCFLVGICGVHRSRGAEKARSSRCGVLPSFRITKCKCRLSEFGVGVQIFRIAVCEVVEVGSGCSTDLCTRACVVARTEAGELLATIRPFTSGLYSFCVVLCRVVSCRVVAFMVIYSYVRGRRDMT